MAMRRRTRTRTEEEINEARVEGMLEEKVTFLDVIEKR